LIGFLPRHPRLLQIFGHWEPNRETIRLQVQLDSGLPRAQGIAVLPSRWWMISSDVQLAIETVLIDQALNLNKLKPTAPGNET
jgi:hypothetical protein